MAENTEPRGVGAVGRARASVAAIETLGEIRKQARKVATAAERVTLSGWSGWGPLAKLFAPDSPSWVDMAEQVGEALSRDDFEMGMRGTYMAFYTPREVAAAIWQMLREFGWDGGPVAELGCGGGAFFSVAPDGVPLVGVERDPTAAAICGLLHPQARVINAPLEDTHLPATFTAVVGNVPFGDVQVFDPGLPADAKDIAGSLHDYFLWRAVQALVPGGYAILITSRYSMDSHRFQRRSAISKDADFVGAVRLPNGALGGGTDALADIVILRRKGGTKKPTYGHAWTDTTHVPWDGATSINQWWVDEPGSVLGTMVKGKTTQYGLNLAVDPHPGGPGLVDRLLDYTRRELVPMAQARNLLWTAPPKPEEFDVHAAGVMSKEGWVEGSMRFTDDGGVLVVKDGRAVPLPKPKDELLRLLRLRDLAVELVRAEADHKRPDQLIEPIRADVRAEYEAYVKRYGPLNRYTQRKSTKRCGGLCYNCEQYERLTKTGADLKARARISSDYPCETPGVDPETGQQQWTRTFPTMQGFRYDCDAQLVFALEVFDDVDEGETEEAEAGMRARPAPIQHARQNVPPPQRIRTDDPVQALAWSLDKFGGKVRMDYIAVLLGHTAVRGEDEHFPAQAEARDQEIAGLLGDRIYLDPETLRWLPAEEYLSGDVRGKHHVAEQAAGQNPRFTRNVEALAAVLPKWLGPDEITANLGTPWIGPDDVADFIQQVIGYAAGVKRAGGQWELDVQGGVRNSVAAVREWGAAGVDAFTLVQLALNGRTPTVYKTIIDYNGDEKQVKDHNLSMLATEKQQEIKQRFGEWVWEGPHRTKRLVNLYNERYNNLVPRRFCGEHITVDGIAPWFDPYKHQLEMVARAIVTPASLCGLPVGSGKTNIMAMTAMKLKQLGLINRPMIVVPNHLIEQVAREVMQLFPAARVLVGSTKTVTANRRAFTARCATQNWDFVLVTHSAFNAMDVDPETQVAYISDLEQELRDGVIDAAGGSLKGRMVKGLAKQLDKMRARVQELRNMARGRDAGVRFEQLGVDFLLIDECFPYDTPVLTDRGPLPIGEIVEGGLAVRVASVDLATGRTEWKPIARWVKKERRQHLVRVTHEHGQFVCTPNHKIWTEEEGYVRADRLLGAGAGMAGATLRVVQEDIRPAQQLETTVLQPVVFGVLAQPATMAGRSDPQDAESGGGRTDWPAPTGLGGTDEDEQPDFRPAGPGEDEQGHERADVPGPWRERATHRPATTAGGTARVADRVRYSDSSRGIEVLVAPALLQGGSGLPDGEPGDRGGRELSQDQEVALPGSPEDGGLGSSRVVSVEVLEPRGAGGHGSGHSGDTYVYNLEVADNHNYFAAGVLVSNCHYYKNLAVPCRTEGFSVRPSKRATDLDMKLRYLRERNGGGPHAALFSGTPISNTMLELYVCLHYTMRDYLKTIGLGSADAWAACYVQFVNGVEVTVDGGDFQMRTRPSLFVNAPELRVLLSQVADIRTDEQLGLKKPAMDLRIVACEPTSTQGWFSTDLVERAEDVRNKTVELNVDNMLKICSDGRRMATDPHLVGLVDDGEYKLHIVAKRMVEVWRQHPGKLQVGFLDLGTPKQRKEGPGGRTWVDYQSYGRLRRMLTEAGMDVRRIRFIHDCKTDADRSRLFRDCKAGNVDVVLGSTDKLGVGTNIQKLIVAMHHVDAPFRPADVGQRDGRGLRPGNIHEVVMVFRYVTKRTFDAYMWQMLTRKLTFIGQMLSGNLDRTVEDMTGDDVLSFAAIKAAATDQPLLAEKAEVDSLVKKLTLKQRSHRQNVTRNRVEAPMYRQKAQAMAAEAQVWEAIDAARDDLDLTDDEVVEKIAAVMDGFRYYQQPLKFGRVTVGWRSWRTRGDQPETHPLLTVDAGGGPATEEGYTFWKATDVKRRLTRLVDRAAKEAGWRRRDEATALEQAAKCDDLAGRAFEQADELTAAKARLDRIEAELYEAASDKTGPVEADGDIVVDDDVDLADLADLADFTGAVADDEGDDGLLAEIASDLSDLFG